ncbi:F-box protein SKIP14-like [Impatiens glandulifera]|uniref:F-box protein SKIP14-like n=1 Tax=Impatiens glandulifera TaxID=253017 RepID=UPI001FB08BD3|nr:F-box protein SKIP14-like [Impatiens glandulifera]
MMEYRKQRSEKLYDDVLDLLPIDPFGMDLTATLTAVSEWLKDIEKDLDSLGFIICEGVEMNKEDDDSVYKGLNLFWNGGPAQFTTDGRKRKINEISMQFHEGLGIALCDGDLVMGSSNIDDDDDDDDSMCFGYEKYWVQGGDVDDNDDDDDVPNSNISEECSIICVDDIDNNDGACPHDAMFFALGYLGVKDLLNIGMVCKSFRGTVQNDPLLWRSIHIDCPLNKTLTDDKLLWLTDRAQGNLQCLCLVECTKITIGGLRRVLERNPGLTKLNIPGCATLSIGNIISCLKSYKSSAFPGIKQLRVGGHHGVTMEQFEELNFLLDIDCKKPIVSHKPRFYGAGNLYLSCDDDRPIDIEACPKCQKPRQVYDCPAESCQSCRACTFCIARCMKCGHCVNDSGYEETFCLDLLCLECWEQIMNFREEMEVSVSSSNCKSLHQQASFRFCVFG